MTCKMLKKSESRDAAMLEAIYGSIAPSYTQTQSYLSGRELSFVYVCN
jgi:hypothetical protein